jgi:phosphotransferase system HPr-like phosphotransfer protein
MRLAVLAGDRVTLRAAGEARAASMIAQPASAFLSQRWTFSPSLAKGQLTALPLGRATR